MSITKHQNEDGELISSVDVNPEKDSLKASYRSSRCSCLDCDSLTCFAKRNKADKSVCQCGICKDLKNCLSITQKKSEERQVGDLKENPRKKIIRETITQETIESLKKVTETMYELGNTDTFEVFTERRSKINKEKDKPMDYGNIERKIKNTVKGKDTDDIKKTDEKGRRIHIPVTQGPSSNELPQRDDDTATKLSAQVMNVPYDKLHQSTSSNQVSEQKPLSKLNIFKRIKEIYDACSCKVCECISSKPFPLQDANVCQCEPCDCRDCTNSRRKIDSSMRRLPHSGCPCVRCDRKDCRGIVKKGAEPQICDCKPCECIQCVEEIFNKPCSCEPCQCINCKSLSTRVQKTVKLGKVDEIFLGEACKCSPCECIECKQIYNRTNPTIMWTTSNEIARHGNCYCESCRSDRCKFVDTEACSCATRNNTTQNAFEKHNNYDVRTVIVNNNGPFKQGKFQNHDTVAFFASLKNNYPQNISNNKNVCKCVDCECITCAAKEEALTRERDTLLGSNVKLLQHAVTMPTPNMNACKCYPCECEICSQKAEKDTIFMHSKCRCDICDCLKCDNASLPTCSKAPTNIVAPIKIPEINSNCNCHPCECHNCKELLSCASNVKFYSDGKSFTSKTVRRLRKVTLISPSSSTKYFDSQKLSSKSVSSITLSPKKSIEAIYKQNIPTFQNDHVLLSHSKYHANDKQSHYDQIYNNDNDLVCNLNIEATETAVHDEPSISRSNIINPNTFESSSHRITSNTSNQISESKSKNLNVIHEKPVKITNDSEEFLSVSGTCSENIHPNNLSSDNTASYVDNNLKDPGTYIEKTHQNVIDTEIILTDDYFRRYPKNSYNDWDYESLIFNNEHDVLHLQSQRYYDPFSTSQRNVRKVNDKALVSNRLDLSTSYQKATTVLHEAKAFSAKLIKMLDSFEAANRNFKSASEKFKNLHMTLLNINETEFEKDYNRTLHLTFENIIEQAPCQEKKIKNENEAEKEYEPSTSNVDHHNNNILEAKDYNPVLKTDSGNINESKHNIEIISDTNSALKQQPSSNINKEERIDIVEPVNALSRNDEVFYPLNNSGISANNINEGNFNEKPKESQSKNTTIDDTKTISLMEKLDSVGKEPTVDAAIVTDVMETNRTDCLQQEERKKWNVFHKNLFLNATAVEMNGKMFGLPALEWDVKEAVQAISLRALEQDLQNRLPTTNEALTNLRSEVRSLLNMPILQSNCGHKYVTEIVEDVCNLQQREEMDLERKSMSSTAASQTYDNLLVAKVDKEIYFNSDQITKENLNRCSRHYGFYRSSSPFNRRIKTSSRKVNETEDNSSRLSARRSRCEELKTSFAGLRRVSDHTVLVKWNLPKRIKDVQGYELLVDGRAVQKIFSPTRSMAVVTCLPNADRVLLTIHTITTTTTTDCGHAPATSIVYRPRIK